MLNEEMEKLCMYLTNFSGAVEGSFIQLMETQSQTLSN